MVVGVGEHSHSYSVVTAADGAEALHLLRDGARPCVILLDWMMPNLDGAAFCIAQRAMPDAAAVPVAVLTASVTGCAEARRLGLPHCFTKPLDAERLVRFVDDQCAAREVAGTTTR